MALHEVASADVFTSPAYRAQAGPSNTGEWQAKMSNWHRNLFARDHTPDAALTWMDAVGLAPSAPGSAPPADV